MKKVMVFIIAMILIMPCAAGASATERRGLVEFVELFTMRLMECQTELNVDFQLIPMHDEPIYVSKADLLMLCFSGGTVFVHPDDLTIHDVSVSVLSSNDNTSEIYNKSEKCVVMLSALEYTGLEDRILRYTNSSALNEANSLVSNQLSGTIQDAYEKLKTPNERIKVYSGNYDYYIIYREEDGNRFYDFYAEEHE